MVKSTIPAPPLSPLPQRHLRRIFLLLILQIYQDALKEVAVLCGFFFSPFLSGIILHKQLLVFCTRYVFKLCVSRPTWVWILPGLAGGSPFHD